MAGEAELGARYVEKKAELDALRKFEIDLLETERIAVRRRDMYRAAIPTVEWEEHIQNLDWWSRFIAIGYFTVAGIAIGIVAGPVAVAWLASSSAASWAAALTGVSAGTLAVLTVTAARLVAPSVASAATNRAFTDKPQTLLGALYEARWQAQYRTQVQRIELKMLGFNDFSFMPALLADPYDFAFAVEGLYRQQATAAKLRQDKIEHYKTRFCVEFWNKIVAKIHWEKLPKGRYGFKSFGTRFTFEISDLESELRDLERILAAEGG